MIPLKQAAGSTIGRKFVMGFSGIALTGFIVLHLLGNLQFLSSNPDHINAYGANFKKLGEFFYLLEWGLFGMFALHAVVGALLWKTSIDARTTRYAVAETKGGNSRWNFSSRNMMLLGAVLGVFVVIHVLQFRFQVFAPHRYETMLDGKPVDDLYHLTMDTFRNPLWVLCYSGTMLFLGLHLRHGIWSMFQSIGAMPSAWSNCIYGAAAVAAGLLALGFIALPVYMYVVQLAG